MKTLFGGPHTQGVGYAQGRRSALGGLPSAVYFQRSGLRVSELCLGAMIFGDARSVGATKEESRNIFDAFVEASGNFIATANTYANGMSEQLLGEFTQDERDRFVLATKYTLNRRATDPNGGGNHRKNLVQSLEASLKRLKTDYIDQVHPVTPSAGGCEKCLATGDTWVHLRLCRVCGHVGCCDSSKNKHATQHYHTTSHPIVQSFEFGENWGWCYTDQTYISLSE